MKRILIADDEEKIREVIKEYATFEGYEVFEAENGMDAVNMCKEHDFDAVILDVMMPKLDGFLACKEIKKIKNIPILMLSARGEEYDKLFGFEIGIDDYVVKPFSPKEVMARLNVIISRNTKTDDKKDVLKFAGLTIDIPARNVFVDGEKIDLTPKEYDLLFYFAKKDKSYEYEAKMFMVPLGRSTLDRLHVVSSKSIDRGVCSGHGSRGKRIARSSTLGAFAQYAEH